jgi:hypothetical protein
MLSAVGGHHQVDVAGCADDRVGRHRHRPDQQVVHRSRSSALSSRGASSNVIVGQAGDPIAPLSEAAAPSRRSTQGSAPLIVGGLGFADRELRSR